MGGVWSAARQVEGGNDVRPHCLAAMAGPRQRQRGGDSVSGRGSVIDALASGRES